MCLTAGAMRFEELPWVCEWNGHDCLLRLQLFERYGRWAACTLSTSSGCQHRRAYRP